MVDFSGIAVNSVGITTPRRSGRRRKRGFDVSVRTAAAAAALLVAAAVTPAVAAQSGTITIHGSTSAWTALDVPAGVAMDLSRATVSGAGRYGGFYVDLGGEHGVGMVRLRDFHVPQGTPHLQNIGDSGEVPRGHHTIYLLADGATTVRIPVTGMASRTLRPARRATAVAYVQELRRDALAMLGRQSLAVARRSVSFSSLLLDDTQVFVGTLSACLTSPGGICNSGKEDGGRLGYYVNPYGAYPFGWTVVYPPGVKSGRLDAVQEAENVAGISFAIGASFTLALA